TVGDAQLQALLRDEQVVEETVRAQHRRGHAPDLLLHGGDAPALRDDMAVEAQGLKRIGRVRRVRDAGAANPWAVVGLAADQRWRSRKPSRGGEERSLGHVTRDL